ncbi:MAG TPA: hypothetical protein VIO57_10105 [Chloroflexota bacterium]|jgi:hypothetical protein
MSDAPLSAEDDAAVQLIVGRMVARAKRDAAEIERLRSALKPLADLAVAIDGDESCAKHKRSDRSTIYQGNAMQRGPWDITMAHARAARAALEA